MSRTNPIFGTDLSKPPHDLIEEIRSNLARLRGQISDIGEEWPEWRYRIKCVEGLLTCGIATLYIARKEMEEFDRVHRAPEKETP